MKKNKYDAKRAIVIKQVALEFEVTEGFVRQCLSGDKKSLTADDIRKRCGALRDNLNKALS
jgi:hypothetical protein